LQIGASRPSPSSADPGTAAEAAVAAWEEIGARLAPVLGPRGVAAIYQRSLRLTLRAHPWLAPACEAPPAGEHAALHAALAAQEESVAAAASAQLLANFRALLHDLIGDALTARLLAPPQRAPPDSAPTKEAPP
jgi:hypothetical protein